MKRLFGLIGLTYLSVLTVVFYLYSSVTVFTVSFVSAFFIVFGITAFVLKIFPNHNREFIVIGTTALCACVVFVLYSNFYYNPLISNYSDKEINIRGYVCEEVEQSNACFIYTIKIDEVNGSSESFKLQIISDSGLDIYAFDCVEGNIILHKNDYNQSKSKGVFFSAYPDDSFAIETTGEKHLTLYSLAVDMRNAMEDALDIQLDSESSSLCKAVLLGNKNALDYELRSDFSKTGSTFLIVVSGMHLSVAASFVLFLVRKITKKKRLQSIAVIVTVFLFMSITGFHSSVVRSGVMTIIAYCGAFVLRRSDSLNSIGIAALVLALPNPFAPGDIGLLLSFSATLGILLWSGKIYGAVISKLEIKKKPLKLIISLVSTSISASLWVIPITTIAFGRISPYVVLLSVFVEPAVCILIVSALMTVLLHLLYIPVFSYFSSLICTLLSKYIIFAVGSFAVIPYSSVKSDKPYFYVWIVLTALLVALGYLIHAKKRYVYFSVLFSVATLLSGYIIYTFAYSNKSTFTLYEMYNGVTAAVESDSNISFISCGGPDYRKGEIFDDVAENHSSVDYIIVPNQKNKYSSYFQDIAVGFDCSDILIYYNDIKDNAKYVGDNIHSFRGNVQFTVNLTSTVSDMVICVDDVVYQFIQGENSSLLFVPSKADISKLPRQFRTADYLLIDDIADNMELLNCKTVLFAATGSGYKDEYNSISELYDEVLCNRNGSISIDL